MSRRKRCDGTLIPPSSLSGHRRLHAFIMDKKNDASVYYSRVLEVEKTLSFLEKKNRGLKEKRISLFTVILAATVRTLALRPKLNRFVAGRKFYQRDAIQLSFVAKKGYSETAASTNVKMTFYPQDTLKDIAERLKERLKKDRNRETKTANEREMNSLSVLPGWLLSLGIKLFKGIDSLGYAPKNMIALDPMYTSAYVANLGSIGLDAPFHHLFEWGNASLFIMAGKVQPFLFFDGGGNPVSRQGLKINFTLDNRVLDGIYAAKAIDLFKGFVEDPEILMSKPEIPEETLAELDLKEYGPKL